MKRIISLMLSMIIILSLVCGAVPAVSAASMKTSDQGINMIKAFEGFSKWPHMDNGQWTVGYGTGVSGADLENYKTNGITEAQVTNRNIPTVSAGSDTIGEFAAEIIKAAKEAGYLQ